MMIRLLAAVALASSTAVAAPHETSPARAEEPFPFTPHELVVGYQPQTTQSLRTEVRTAVDAAGYRSTPTMDVIRLPKSTSVRQAIELVGNLPQILYAEPNYRITAAEEPNDPLYTEAWSVGPSNPSGFRSGIDTPSVWNLTVGGNVPVAIVDSGIDMSHPDLVQNLWTNAGEAGDGRETNGLDDDGNGYIDDWRGWDWTDEDNDPTDLNGHGTGVAGTIGAQGDNGLGASGVSWRTRLMPLRVLDNEGIGLTSDAAAAFSYAAATGVKVVNASLTSTYPSIAVMEAITSAPETLFVVAAGNDGTNNDAQPKYPCNIATRNVVCVASTDEYNHLSSFSNFGAISVDLAAPGEHILATHPDGYTEFFGTSFASPHVAGAAALLWTRHPDSSVDSVVGALLQGSDPMPNLQGKTASGGRLNAAGAFRQLGDSVPHDEGGRQTKEQVGDGSQQKEKRCRHHKRHRRGARRKRCRRR